MSEVQQALQDPTAAVNIVVGPPVADLVAQDPNVSPGVRFAGLYEHEPRRFVFKKAHLSREDFRIFDSHPSGMGQLVCVSHHHGEFKLFSCLLCSWMPVHAEIAKYMYLCFSV